MEEYAKEFMVHAKHIVTTCICDVCGCLSCGMFRWRTHKDCQQKLPIVAPTIENLCTWIFSFASVKEMIEYFFNHLSRHYLCHLIHITMIVHRILPRDRVVVCREYILREIINAIHNYTHVHPSEFNALLNMVLNRKHGFRGNYFDDLQKQIERTHYQRQNVWNLWNSWNGEYQSLIEWLPQEMVVDVTILI